MAYNPDMPSTPPAGGDGGVAITALAAEFGASPEAIAAARAKIADTHPELADALDKGYEPHDIGLRGVFLFLISLVITMAVVLAAMWGVMMLFVNYDRSNDPIASPVKVEDPVPAAPLQPSPMHNYNDREDLTLMRKDVYASLDSSGVTASGRRFIPIEEAMKQVLRTLKVKPAIPANEPHGEAADLSTR